MDLEEVKTRFDHVEETALYDKYERAVKTPVNDGAVEENVMTVYHVREYGDLIRVAKISTLGWSVTVYTEQGTIQNLNGTEHYTNREDAEQIVHGDLLERYT